jgi:uracil phosphoribosyltransferase
VEVLADTHIPHNPALLVKPPLIQGRAVVAVLAVVIRRLSPIKQRVAVVVVVAVETQVTPEARAIPAVQLTLPLLIVNLFLPAVLIP